MAEFEEIQAERVRLSDELYELESQQRTLDRMEEEALPFLAYRKANYQELAERYVQTSISRHMAEQVEETSQTERFLYDQLSEQKAENKQRQQKLHEREEVLRTRQRMIVNEEKQQAGERYEY